MYVRNILDTGKRKEKGEIMRKEMIQNLAGVVLLFIFITLSVMFINARIEQTQDITPAVSLSK
jgi:hypothetical protein